MPSLLSPMLLTVNILIILSEDTPTINVLTFSEVALMVNALITFYINDICSHHILRCYLVIHALVTLRKMVIMFSLRGEINCYNYVRLTLLVYGQFVNTLNVHL